MKILYINESPEVHERYKNGMIPSHWFYGAVEMEQDGHEVIWCQEKSGKLYDLSLVRQHKPDIIYLPNLNVKNHIILLLLVWLRLIRTPVYAYLHHSPKLNEGMKTRLYRLLLPALKYVFFLSEKSMYETIERGFIRSEKCSVPGWGPDRCFYDKVVLRDEGYFISTGKENRDFDILIEAFGRTGAPLKIMTAKAHAGSDYTNLEEKCKDIPNIDVVLTENSSNVFPMMLEAMSKAKALVCPLRQDRLDYCVGLSTIADAEGLRKPLIITHNPYHSSARMQKFDVVTTVDEWVRAIERIQKASTKDLSSIDTYNEYSMQNAYSRMKQKMNV